MDNVFEKWDSNKEYSKGEAVYFGDKIYVATKDNTGILPIHRKVMKNAFNKLDNDNLVDQLILEYDCEEDFPEAEAITYEGVTVTYEDEIGINPITHKDETLFNWRIA
jgi:hypothetical protein